MTALSIMQPRHPRWREFLARLASVPRCLRTTEHSRAILATMDGIDADRSLVALHDMGGHCDCAILFDIESEVGLHAG